MTARVLTARLPARTLDGDGIEPIGADVRVALDAGERLTDFADSAAVPTCLSLGSRDFGFERIIVV
jgi:hypothetical protein